MSMILQRSQRSILCAGEAIQMTQQCWSKPLNRLSSGAQIIDITHRLLMPDGSVKHVKVLAHPAQDKEDNVEYIGVLMDITAAKQAEEAIAGVTGFTRPCDAGDGLGGTDRVHSP